MLPNSILQKISEQAKKKFNVYAVEQFYREYDDCYEIIGKVDDPTLNMNDFYGRELLFPKKWVTLEVVNSQGEKV